MIIFVIERSHRGVDSLEELFDLGDLGVLGDMDSDKLFRGELFLDELFLGELFRENLGENLGEAFLKFSDTLFNRFVVRGESVRGESFFLGDTGDTGDTLCGVTGNDNLSIFFLGEMLS